MGRVTPGFVQTGEAWLPRASTARAHRAYCARVHGAHWAGRVGGHVGAHGLQGGQTWPRNRATSCSCGATYGTMAQSLWWATGSDIVAIPLVAGVLAPSGMVHSPASGDAARGDEERPAIGRLSLLRAR